SPLPCARRHNTPELERAVRRATLPAYALSTKRQFLAQVTEPQACVNASLANKAALRHRRPSGAYPGSLAGITNGVQQREASENVQRSVTAFLKASRSCEPD